MSRYLYTFEIKSAKSKICKGAELSALGTSWECWFGVSEGEGSGQDNPVSVAAASDHGFRQRSGAELCPSLSSPSPCSEAHERRRKATCPGSAGGAAHTLSPRQRRTFDPSGFPASRPPTEVPVPSLPCPSCTDHTARVSASIFCSPWRFSSSCTWATFCLMAISGPPPYRVLK